MMTDYDYYLISSILTSGLYRLLLHYFIRAVKEELVTGSKVRIIQNKEAFI